MNNAKWFLAILVLGIAGLVMPLHQPKRASPKIVGGHEVQIHSVPFLLSMVTIKEGETFLCGATILSASWGMSAFHCLFTPKMVVDKDYWLRVTRIRAGSSRWDDGGSLHRLKDLYWYSTEYYWKPPFPKNDIMLFKVTPTFRFSANIKPARLPDAESTPPKWLQVSGWGETDPSREPTAPSQFLQAVNVSKVEWETCARLDSDYQRMVIMNKNLCYGRRNTDSCYGDSGGPLADYDTIYGIVSFGAGCAVVPGVYTDVSYYRYWIKRITNL